MSHISTQAIVESLSAFTDDLAQEPVDRKVTRDPDWHPEDVEESHLDEEALVAILACVLTSMLSFLELKLAEQLLISDKDKRIEPVAEDRRDENEPLDVLDEFHNESCLNLRSVEVVAV